MSAIAGLRYLDGRRVARTDLDRMVASLAHRGPRAGAWRVGAVGIGHRMLCTTLESLGEVLPRRDEAKGTVLTADARIDNREDLIREFGLRDRTARQITDSELILRAYDRWGERCPEHLLGDFAFAVWDGRAQRLFCARDRFGVRPFCYHHRPGRLFAFASEMKALLELDEVPGTIDDVWIGDFLAGVKEDREITFYQAIRRLPAAHTLVVTRDRMVLRRYWALDPERETRYRSDDQYAEAFRELFTDSVRARMRTAFPLGASLSGGLDSSSVVCTARQILRQGGEAGLHTYSWVFDETPQCDERPFIEAVLAGGDLTSHYVHADHVRPVENPELFFALDQPPYAANIGLDFGSYPLMRELGARVVLDGFLGDSVVSWGTQRMGELLRRGRWIELARAVRQHAANVDVPAPLAYRKYFWWALKRDVVKPMLPETLLRLVGASKRPSQPLTTWGDNILNAEFARRLDLRERHRALNRNIFRTCRTVREAHHVELSAGVFGVALELVDEVSAAHSIESRSPFLDTRLVEFCLSLPSAQKFHRGWTRMIQRRGMEGILPEAVRWRGSKGDMSAWYVRGLRTYEMERLTQTLTEDAPLIEPYVDIEDLRAASRRFQETGQLTSGGSLWRAMMLAAWLRRSQVGAPTRKKKGGALGIQTAAVS